MIEDTGVNRNSSTAFTSPWEGGGGLDQIAPAVYNSD